MEYVKLLPTIIKNRDKIIEGWINDAKLERKELSEEETEVILTRRSICSQCPLNSFNLKNDDSEYQKLYEEPFKTERTEEFCGCCNCTLSKKTASFASQCGLESYNLEHPENKQELKWLNYKK